jgi:hypothetical protein
LFEGSIELFDPSTQSRACPSTLAWGRPERSESRDDDLLGENVEIGKLVELFEGFRLRSRKMSRPALSR